ncbi:MAG: polysaccharide biosynthesis tyrosine autokinase [Calothrix sp. MO_167.B12]|nr:polysaccharide biosynthesis tyrosine autokinase [Calothrix sp. MO_167.B12]
MDDYLASGNRLKENRAAIDLDLQKYLQACKRRWLPATSIFVITVSLTASLLPFLKPSYTTEGKLLFQKVDKTSSLTGLGKIGNLQSIVANQTPLTTEIEVINSHPILEKTIKKLQLKDNKGQLFKPEDLKKKIDIKIIGATDVIQISYKSKKPQEAADVVNTLMTLYIDNQTDKNRSEVIAVRQFINKQLPEIEKEVLNAEARLRKFREQNKVVDLAKEAEVTVLEIAALNRQITTLESDLNAVKAQSTKLQSELGLNLEQAMTVNILSTSPEIQSAIAELRTVESELTNQKKLFLNQHPNIIALENKKEILENLIQQKSREVANNRAVIPYGLLQSQDMKANLVEEFITSAIQNLKLTQQLASLYQSRDIYEKRSLLLPKLQQHQEILERKVEAAKATYNTLLTKLPEVQVTENKKTDNVNIIQLAEVPEKGSILKHIVVLLLGIMLGLFLSTSSILLLEIRDKSLKSLEEIKELFAYTLLGITPSLQQNKYTSRKKDIDLITPEVPVRNAPNSFIGEIYRMIQANIKFLSSDKELRVIVVTSSVPKEGKSTVAANLAAVIAQLGRRVLLIDADLRQPVQHHIWELNNNQGLSNLLVGQTEFSPAVCQDIEHLEILTSGVKPPNSLALLDSQRMSSFIQSTTDKYDFVIIDSPPLLLTADALTLGRMSDGILLVNRPEILDRKSATLAKEMLERSEQNVLGLVVNGINKKEFNTYFYHAKTYLTDEDWSDYTSSNSPISLSKLFNIL